MSEILMRKDGAGSWESPSGKDYDDEAHLQKLLADHPGLIPGVGPRAKACRELQLEVGPSDIVVVDESARITLVECKLARNPEVRREIIGQLFDYAGRLWKLGVEEFDTRWKSRTGQSLFVGEIFSTPEFYQAFGDNLNGGNFTLVLAVDAINPSLRRMVEYVNGITGVETSVIAVEYTRFVGAGAEVLIPKTYGLDSAETKKSEQGKLRQKWRISDVATALSENSPEALEPFEYLVRGLSDLGFEFQSGQGSLPSGLFTREVSSGVQLRPLHVATTSGPLLELNFDAWVSAWLAAGGSSESLAKLQSDWMLIPELAGAMRPILETSSRRRSIYLYDLTPKGSEEMLQALESFVEST